jgi:hypothetical protein
MGETNSPSVAHVGYDISPLSRVKFKILSTSLTTCGYNLKFNSLEWRNIVTHGQLKENLYVISIANPLIYIMLSIYRQLWSYGHQNGRRVKCHR